MAWLLLYSIYCSFYLLPISNPSERLYWFTGKTGGFTKINSFYLFSSSTALPKGLDESDLWSSTSCSSSYPDIPKRSNKGTALPLFKFEVLFSWPQAISAALSWVPNPPKLSEDGYSKNCDEKLGANTFAVPKEGLGF